MLCEKKKHMLVTPNLKFQSSDWTFVRFGIVWVRQDKARKMSLGTN